MVYSTAIHSMVNNTAIHTHIMVLLWLIVLSLMALPVLPWLIVLSRIMALVVLQPVPSTAEKLQWLLRWFKVCPLVLPAAV